MFSEPTSVNVPVIDIGGGRLAHVTVGNEAQMRVGCAQRKKESEVVLHVPWLPAVLHTIAMHTDRNATGNAFSMSEVASAW